MIVSVTNFRKCYETFMITMDHLKNFCVIKLFNEDYEGMTLHEDNHVQW